MGKTDKWQQRVQAQGEIIDPSKTPPRPSVNDPQADDAAPAQSPAQSPADAQTPGDNPAASPAPTPPCTDGTPPAPGPDKTEIVETTPTDPPAPPTAADPQAERKEREYIDTLRKFLVELETISTSHQAAAIPPHPHLDVEVQAAKVRGAAHSGWVQLRHEIDAIHQIVRDFDARYALPLQTLPKHFAQKSH